MPKLLPPTVKFVLKDSHPDFSLMTMGYCIKMQEAGACSGDLGAPCESGAGTGPFELINLDALDTTAMKRFENGHGSKAGVEYL